MSTQSEKVTVSFTFTREEAERLRAGGKLGAEERRQLGLALQAEAQPSEGALEVVVDFLGAWRFCPISEAESPSRGCLEDAARQLLAALPDPQPSVEQPSWLDEFYDELQNRIVTERQELSSDLAAGLEAAQEMYEAAMPATAADGKEQS